VRNWKAFQKLGISNVNAPAMYHSSVALTEAVSLGDLKHAETPDDPVVLHLVRAPCAPGKTKNEQFRAGRPSFSRRLSISSSERFAISLFGHSAVVVVIRMPTSLRSPSIGGRMGARSLITAFTIRSSGR
jgi:hypothetical protein